MLKTLSELSNTISTIASFAGEAILEPIKIKLLAFAALIDFIDKRPRTKHSASEMFDFPEPFGPRTTLIP